MCKLLKCLLCGGIVVSISILKELLIIPLVISRDNCTIIGIGIGIGRPSKVYIMRHLVEARIVIIVMM